MQVNQLPQGVNAVPASETPAESAGAVTMMLREDLRIFRVTYNLSRPYRVQGCIKGKWRTLSFSRGPGKTAERGFANFSVALERAGEVKAAIETAQTGKPDLLGYLRQSVTKRHEPGTGEE